MDENLKFLFVSAVNSVSSAAIRQWQVEWLSGLFMVC